MEDEETTEVQYLEGAPWSWSGLAAELTAMIAAQVECVAEFIGSISIQFQRMHNKFVDECDREQFATDFMSGLKDL